jgi:hypothetical protein
MDLFATLIPAVRGVVNGINPYWKLALIFKCLTDNIMLDDFKTELQRLGGNNLLERSMIRPPSPQLSPLTQEKSQSDHVEIADPPNALERNWDLPLIRPPRATHRPSEISRSLS